MITNIKTKTVIQSTIELTPLLKDTPFTYKRVILIGNITGTAEIYIQKSFPEENVRDSITEKRRLLLDGKSTAAFEAIKQSSFS